MREETDGANKRLRLYGAGANDYFRFVIGNELFDASRVLEMSNTNVF